MILCAVPENMKMLFILEDPLGLNLHSNDQIPWIFI